MKRQGDLFDNNISNFFQTPKHSKVLQDFYIKLQDSGKAKLLALVRTSLRDPKLDCVRLLAELSNEQNFDVTYVDIGKPIFWFKISSLYGNHLKVSWSFFF